MIEHPDRFCAPLWGAKHRRMVWLPWFIWFFAIVGLIAFVAWIASCAHTPLPRCEGWDSKLLVRDGQVMGLYLDGENAEKLIAMIEGLAKGTCRLAPREATL